MRLIDLSQPIFDDCPNCPEHPPVRSEIIADHPAVGWRLEKLTLVNHTGSHVDAPLHKLAGARSLDDIPLEKWVGPAYLLDLRPCTPDQRIGPDDLAPLLKAANGDLRDRIVLLCTGWGDERAQTDRWLNHAPLLSPAGAHWLVDHQVRGVGIDYYSIGDATVHEILLRNDLWIVEELRFPAEVWDLPQPVEFWTLPVNFKGHTGAFCRPVISVR
ncbi:MAG TPA: cyclase family protein [Tepidisphaeraceae bacterium]|nr:cyclase family protein [Tepidisphaeraceae bacterium]